MATAQVRLPPKLVSVFTGEADVRGAYGGRGSAKTRSFALMSAVRAYKFAAEGRNGLVLCGRQFQNSLEDSSLEEVKGAIRDTPWLEPFFDIGEKYIQTKDGRISYTFSGLDRSINSIKGKSRILLAWVDEAEHVLEVAWVKLIPTIREDGSELWVTWNPERKGSPTDQRFRNSNDPLFKITEMNWRDNPWFPAKLERERLRDKENKPEQYEHIWEGGYKTVTEGAYYASSLTTAREEGRVGRVAADPLMTIRLFFDIGGTGAKADAVAIWAAQFIGKEIRWLRYYEAVGQPLATHVTWLREQGYTPDKAQIWLPHDGATHDRVHAVSYESALQDAGYTVTVVPNQGRGAAKARILVTQRLFSRMWFDEEGCEGGLEALGAYHEKRDEERQIGLGPEHDWSSHGADACGLGCVVYEEPEMKKPARQEKPKWVV